MEWFNRFLNGIKDRAGRKRGIRGRGGGEAKGARRERAKSAAPLARCARTFLESRPLLASRTPLRTRSSGKGSKGKPHTPSGSPYPRFRARSISCEPRTPSRTHGKNRMEAPIWPPAEQGGHRPCASSRMKARQETPEREETPRRARLHLALRGPRAPARAKREPRTTRNHGKEPGSLVQEAASETIRRYGASRNPFRHAPRRGFGTARRRPRRRSRSAR